MAHGLLTPAAVVDGEVTVHDRSGRNRGFSVVSSDSKSFFVKFSPSGDGLLTREAAILLAARHAAMPELYCSAPDEGALVLGLVDGAHTLRDHQARGRFSQRVARALGHTPAAVHGQDPVDSAAPLPYGLGLHRPPLAWLREISEAGLTLVKRIQADRRLVGALDEL